jgi:hypothetical protein
MSCKALKPKQKAADPAFLNPEGQWLSGDHDIPRGGGSVSSEETYPTVAEAITAAAIKPLDMPERLATLDRTGA